MSRIPQPFIDDLLSRLDIVSVIDSRVKLKKNGKNYSACCPFHQEKTPSFTVSPDKQFYYCFGCGASGNAIGFVMEYEREGFIDAVESLAKAAGLEVPREESSNGQQQDFRRKKLFSILDEANQFFQAQLKQHPQKHHAVRYLKSRGLTGHIARRFSLGYAPAGRDNLLTALGTNEERTSLLIDAGLVISKEEENKIYDRFRHRIIFPIGDERGRVIGFGGRVLGDDKPKYLNSPETEVFRKGRELYGLHEAKQQRNIESLLVVEGYMDVIALSQFGVHNAVATLGTACGEEHLKLAFRYAGNVVFCFDGDNAGRTAAKRALVNSLSSMEDGRHIKFLFLPEGQDPDSLIRQIGTDRFITQTQQAVPLEEFLFDVAADGIDIGSMDGRARFSKTAAPLLAQLPDGVFKELMNDNLARRTGLTREILNELQHETPPQEIEFKPQTNVARDPEPPATLQTNTSRLPLQRNRSQAKTSPVKHSPTKTATILLLEYPELLRKLDNVPDLSGDDDPDNRRLHDIIDYVRKRPDSNFNNILGYWGGSKGVGEQQALASLMADQLMNSAKTINTYDPTKEFLGAIESLMAAIDKSTNLREYAALKTRSLHELSSEEKNRLRQLSRLFEANTS